jgi:uroporphyrinogen decarboxylase
MSKWERLEASIQQQPTDRVPWALWRHFYDRETSAEDLARVMLDWQARNDFDLLKVNPRAQYHAEAWGCRFRYSGLPDVKPVPEHLVVQSVQDWQHIDFRPPTTPAFAEQLQALAQIGRGLRGAVPFVETVFCPLGVAGYLISDELELRRHLREHPAVIHQALAAITESLVAFVHEVLNAGASGIFFATTAWATRDMLTEAEYETFGRPYDLQVLKAASEARVNVLHVCRKNNMLRLLLDYPVQVLNWAATEEGNPSLGEIADAVTARAVAGGLSNEALTAPTDAKALADAARAADQARNRGLILAGNCSIPVQSSQQVIDALHRWLL